MSRHLDSSTPTQMDSIMVKCGRSSRSSWAKSVGSSFGRSVMGKAICQNPIEVRLGEGFQLVMLIRTPWKRVVLICGCGWHLFGWKETKHYSDVESAHQRSWFGRTNIFPWSCFPWGALKDDVKRYCWQLQNHVWIQNFRQNNWKIPFSENLHISSWFYDKEGHAKKCVDDIVRWRTRRLNNSTKYLLHASMTTTSKKKNWNPWENCHKYALIFSEMLILGKNWKNWFSMVSEQTCTINHKMDQSLWQTPESIDILHSSYMWLQTILLCG